ncbi:MAG: acyl-CoA transferase [Alphaproteobacteria bacterium]|nr:acyl-CoA transferase [Alphaproteobacteria bacterium]
MADSVREAALKALHALLLGIDGPRVVRNEPETAAIPAGGLVVLRDGDPGEPEVLLSPPAYEYAHRAEIVVQVQHGEASERDAAMDTLLQQIGAALDADQTLGGAVDMAMAGGPELLDEPVEGAATIKAALIPVTLDYMTSTPLG